MRRVLAAALLFSAAAPGCKRFFSFGRPEDAGAGGGGGGGGLASALASLVGFEGEIDMAISSPAMGAAPGPMMTVTMKIKGDRMRVETAMPALAGAAPPATSFATILDGAKKKSYMLMPATREYAEIDLDASRKTPSPPTPKAVITRTGRTDKVAGYPCSVLGVADPATRERTEVCATKGLTLLGLPFGPLSGMGAGTALDDAMKEGFPLRLETFDASGAPLMKMEAARIDKKSEPDSEFEIPVGWKKSAMFGGVGAGPGGGGVAPPTGGAP